MSPEVSETSWPSPEDPGPVSLESRAPVLPLTASALPQPVEAASQALVGEPERWWLIPLLIALASRLWGSLLVTGFATSSWPLFRHPPAAGPTTVWDGGWYLEIARFGYHAVPIAGTTLGWYHDFSFWPAWPALFGAALRGVPLPADLIGGLLANGLTIAGLVLWSGVLIRHFGRSSALYAIALIAFAPPAFILSMSYSEPLFLLLSGLFFYLPARSRIRPLLSALAQATRLTGFAVGASALAQVWRARGRDGRAWISLLLPGFVFAAWWIFIAVLTGNPLGFMLGSPSWLTTSGQVGGPISFFHDYAGVGSLVPIGISAGFVLLISLGTIRLALERRWELAIYAGAAILPSLALANWQSMPRHLLIAVPAAGALMAPISIRTRRLLLFLSIGAELVYAIFVLGVHFAP